jgi:hypothetical protein
MADIQFKQYIKNKTRMKAFNDLRILQQGHSKVRDIQYVNLTNPQPYLKSNLFTNKMCSLLSNLRCRTVGTIKENFSSQYNYFISCDLCGWIDNQEHVLECPVLSKHESDSHIKYSHIFGTVTEQRYVTILFARLLEERDRLLEARVTLPGAIQDHPTCI